MIPIVWSLVYSLYSWNGISEMRFIGLDNYVKLFTRDYVFWAAVKNNLIYVCMSVTMKVIIGMVLAVLLTSIKFGKEVYKTLFFIPAILSSVVLAQLFVRVYATDPVGILNGFLRILNLSVLEQAWLTDKSVVLLSVAFVDAFKYVGIYMVIYYTALISIPNDVIESASLDGANALQQFFYLKLPLIKGVFVASLIMLLSGTLKEFDLPYLLTGGGPGHASEMVTTHMYKTAFSTMQYGYGSAIAFFIVVECLLIVGAFRKILLTKE